MEQQQYKYTETSGPVRKPESRFLRIWGPVLIKWAIGMGVSMIAVLLFESLTILKKSGVDVNAVQNMAQAKEMITRYMLDASKSAELAREAAEELMKYTTPIEGIAAFLTIPVLLFMFHKDTVREKLAGIIPNKKAALWKYAGILVMAAAMTLGLNNLIDISGIMAVSEGYEEAMDSFYAAPFAMQIVCLGILIPVCEELVFRGLMFRRLRPGNSFFAAALYSSLVFGFFHMNMVQMMYGFFLGFTFCYLYEKYGSVKAPVAAHISSNVLSIVLTEINAMEWMAKEPVRMGVITVLCASAASTMYVLIRKIEERPDEAEKK